MGARSWRVVQVLDFGLPISRSPCVDPSFRFMDFGDFRFRWQRGTSRHDSCSCANCMLAAIRTRFSQLILTIPRARRSNKSSAASMSRTRHVDDRDSRQLHQLAWSLAIGSDHARTGTNAEAYRRCGVFGAPSSTSLFADREEWTHKCWAAMFLSASNLWRRNSHFFAGQFGATTIRGWLVLSCALLLGARRARRFDCI